jgi:hypothetical protein
MLHNEPDTVLYGTARGAIRASDRGRLGPRRAEAVPELR